VKNKTDQNIIRTVIQGLTLSLTFINFPHINYKKSRRYKIWDKMDAQFFSPKYEKIAQIF